MYSIFICDDEPVFLNRIGKVVEDFFKDKADCTISLQNNAAELPDNLPKSDLYLLDIYMPEISGFDLASRIRSSYPDSTIIFISSLKEPVFESFRYAPLRYIRKEYMETELCDALSAFLKTRQTDLLSLYLQTKPVPTEILVSSIRYIESNGHYLVFYCTDGEHCVRGKLGEYADKLYSHHFACPHKSYLVNLQIVSVVSKKEIFLDTGLSISISRTCRDSFLTAFMTYQRSFHHDIST